MAKTCPRCKTMYINEKKHFHKNKLNKDGLSSICKKCKREETLFYRKAKEVVIEKVCEFKECNNIIKTTNNLRKYCCNYCRDRANKFKNGKDAFRNKVNFINRFKSHKEKATAKNYCKRWSDEEIKTLLNLRENGFSYREIGLQLGRQTASCSKKYYSIKGK